jgi:hypothetical protein
VPLTRLYYDCQGANKLLDLRALFGRSFIIRHYATVYFSCEIAGTLCSIKVPFIIKDCRLLSHSAIRTACGENAQQCRNGVIDKNVLVSQMQAARTNINLSYHKQYQWFRCLKIKFRKHLGSIAIGRFQV